MCLTYITCVGVRRSSEHSEEEAQAPAVKKARLDPFANLRDGASTASTAGAQPSGTVPLSGRQELARYKAMQVSSAYGGPLDFWRQQKGDYQVLSEVAHQVYCIPASSAQSERDFSSLRQVITDVRSPQLSADNVESNLSNLFVGAACQLTVSLCDTA